MLDLGSVLVFKRVISYVESGQQSCLLVFIPYVATAAVEKRLVTRVRGL